MYLYPLPSDALTRDWTKKDTNQHTHADALVRGRRSLDRGSRVVALKGCEVVSVGKELGGIRLRLLGTSGRLYKRSKIGKNRNKSK